MNTGPNATTVLCYGDSNTHGSKPDKSGRYMVTERWPGILQDLLGGRYYIIEEGLGGRTTDLEHIDSTSKPNRNGLTYFKPCFESHIPLDFVIIMLGTNDLKTAYNRSPKEIAQALKQYPDFVRIHCESNGIKQPKIILVSPAHMDGNASKFIGDQKPVSLYNQESVQKSYQLAEEISKTAEETGCLFFDAAKVTSTGEDGCHLDLESHNKLANGLAELFAN